MSNSSNSSSGVSILGLLGILFVALKLTGVISWSWWLVTFPFWGIVALVSLLTVFAGIYLLLRIQPWK